MVPKHKDTISGKGTGLNIKQVRLHRQQEQVPCIGKEAQPNHTITTEFQEDLKIVIWDMFEKLLNKKSTKVQQDMP